MPNSIALIALILAATISACHQYPVDTGPARIDTIRIFQHSDSLVEPTGSLNGQVVESDYRLPYQNTPALSFSPSYGAVVSIDSTSFRTVTDSSGRWSMAGVPSGIYTFTISKTGFGNYKIFNFPFVGGGPTFIPGKVFIGRIPSEFTVYDLHMFDTAYAGVECWISPARPDGDGVGVKFFVGVDPSVSSNYTTYRMFGESTGDNGTSRFRWYFSQQLSKAGFKSGDRVYIAAYVFVLDEYREMTYWDPYLNEYINPTIYPVRSNVISYTLP